MRVDRVDDASAFLEAAAPLLLRDEARHNLMIGLAGTLRDHPHVYPEHRLWVVRDRETVVGAALRTPPHNLIVSKADPAALEALARHLGDDPAGVVGALPEVDVFTGAWARTTGRTPRRVRDQGLFALEQVRRPSPVGGRMRFAARADRDLLSAWYGEFIAEAIGERLEPDELGRAVDLRFETPSKGLVIWDDGGPVSFAGYGDPTPNGIRIGPVYTPPDRRRRGYASALTAALSQHLLDQGRRFCFLYTDLANPTANRIYERIGYERVCESAEIAFS